jgi:hypothetical protein
VQGRVIELGNFSDIQSLFALQPICLLTSLREALPGSVMEAHLAGRPCFMYPCEGAEDIYGPHQSEFVSADFTPEALIHLIHPLLQNPSRLHAQAQLLHHRAENQFSILAHWRELQTHLGL